MSAIKSLIDSIRYAPFTGGYRVWIHIEIWDMFAKNSNIKIGTGSRTWRYMRKIDEQVITRDDCVAFHKGLESIIKLLNASVIDYRLSLSSLSTDIKIGISIDSIDLVCNMLEALFFPQQPSIAETP